MAETVLMAAGIGWLLVVGYLIGLERGEARARSLYRARYPGGGPAGEATDGQTGPASDFVSRRELDQHQLDMEDLHDKIKHLYDRIRKRTEAGTFGPIAPAAPNGEPVVALSALSPKERARQKALKAGVLLGGGHR